MALATDSTAIADTPAEPVPGRFDARAAASVRLALFSDTYPPQLNGVSRTLERLVAAVRARGGAVRVYTTTDPGAADAAGLSGDIWRRPSVPFWAYPQLRISAPVRGAAYTDLRAWRPTLIHAATPFGMGLAGRGCARALGVPLVTSYHTSFNEYAKFYRLGALSGSGWAYIRWFHNSGARTFVPTRAVMEELRRLRFHRLALWGRGVDTTRFNPAFRSPALRARLGADDDTVVVAYVGRLAAEKGLEVALGAMRELAPRAIRNGDPLRSDREGRGGRPRIIFAVAGDGPYAQHCRRTAPPAPAVHFLGRLEGRALSELYASADLFIFPSATDTFGNVLLEAMASGVAVIGADVGPTRELLAAGGGITVPAGDAHAFADAIEGLTADPARRGAIARDGAIYAATCSWNHIFNDLITAYRDVIADAGAALGRRAAGAAD
jgi:glycosyltransferase involved in cell wall biosynthesis